MPEWSKSRKSIEKLEVSRCMSSGRGVNHLISSLSTQARGVSAHGSSTCGVTHKSMRCRRICDRSMLIDMWALWCRITCNQDVNQTCGGRGVTLHAILSMMTAMWSTRCRRACNRSHAERHTGCHQLEGDWLLSSINRHVHLHSSHTSRPLQISLKM